MKLIILLLGLIVITKDGIGQNDEFIISGEVYEKGGGPVYGAFVKIESAKGTFQSSVSTSTGEFNFVLTDTGTYSLIVSHAGFQSFRKRLQITKGPGAANLKRIKIELTRSTLLLDSVTLTGQKKAYRIRNNVLTIFPESILAAQSSTALDLLERAPGVSVDRTNQQIRIRGKEGVVLIINGRTVPVNSEDIGTFLNGINASNLESIEVITNPNSTFDANGNAGVIQIKMKQAMNAKLSGRLSSTFVLGRRTKSLQSLSISGKLKAVTYFFSLDYNIQPTFTPVSFRRQIPYAGGFKALEQRLNFDHDSHIIPASLNIVWPVNKRLSFSLFANLFKQSNATQENNSAEYSTQNKIDSALYFDNQTKLNLKRLTNGVSMVYKLDSLGSQLSNSIDYLLVHHQERNKYPGIYKYANGTQIAKEFQATYDIQGAILAIKSDYKKVISKKANVQTGVKWLLVDVTSIPVFVDKSSPSLVYPKENNISFRYREQVFAGYLNYNTNINKHFSIDAGLRIETTLSKSYDLASGTVLNRNYTDLFPSMQVIRKPGSKYASTLTIARRMDRPTYVALNPNIRFRSPLLYVKGNSFLTPQYTSAIEFVQRIGKLSLVAGYDKVSNKWQFTQYILPNTDIAEGITVNTEKFNSIYIQTNYTTNVGKNIQWTWNATYTKSVTRFNLSDTFFANTVSGMRINSTTSFKPKGKWNFEVFFQFEGPYLDGIFQYRSRWQINPTVQYAVNSKSSFRLTVTDPFRKYVARYSANFRNLITDNEVDFETTTIRLNFGMRFGGKTTSNQQGRPLEDQFNRL